MSELLLVACRAAHSEVTRIPIERFEDDDDRLHVTVQFETLAISTELRWKHVLKKNDVNYMAVKPELFVASKESVEDRSAFRGRYRKHAFRMIEI